MTCVHTLWLVLNCFTHAQSTVECSCNFRFWSPSLPHVIATTFAIVDVVVHVLVVPPTENNRVDHELGGISKLESPCGGRNSSQRIEGGVAMISRMLPYPGAPVSGAGGGGGFPVEVEAFAQGVQDAWRIGKRGCNNGFLLFASKEDRNFAISVVSTSFSHLIHLSVRLSVFFFFFSVCPLHLVYPQVGGLFVGTYACTRMWMLAIFRSLFFCCVCVFVFWLYYVLNLVSAVFF